MDVLRGTSDTSKKNKITYINGDPARQLADLRVGKAMSLFAKIGTSLDANGQPLFAAFNSEKVTDKQVDELLGIIKGVMADGFIDLREVQFLATWMEANRGAFDCWPANVLYPRIAKALADGKIDLEEERELMTLLLNAVGGNTAPIYGHASDSTSLPFNDPNPAVAFEGKSFCFTGAFNAGTRDWCQKQVTERGGIPSDSITKKLNYLVIGEIGSRDWRHSTFGRKIEKAVSYRDTGVPLVIIGEQHWHSHLQA